MKILLHFILVFIICGNFSIAQGQMFENGGTVNRSASGQIRSPQERDAMRSIYEQERQNRDFSRLRNTNHNAQFNVSMNLNLYSKEQLAHLKTSIEPDATDKGHYFSFLQQPKTGIIKLLAENDCLKSFENNILQFDEMCPQQMLFGRGAYYSFRRNDYSSELTADLGFKGDWLFSLGLLTQGILVQLGDVQIENLSSQSEGVKFLTDFIPATKPEEADKQSSQFENGLQVDNFFYVKTLKLIPNQTYTLRAIAYRGEVTRIYEIERRKFKINLLAGDERKDVLIVFRVLRKDTAGNATIVWKELQRKNTFKLELSKEQAKK